MSFKSLVNKLMKEGKSKEAATKIAGKVASEKMKGAGSGPTAKQKARMKKSPAKKYDRVVLGGNKGDKSKTKPGKKDYESPAKMKKSPAKKPLTGKQKNLPDHLKKAILDAPAKMLSKSGMKMMKDGSPAKMSANKAEVKKKKQEEKTKRTAIRQGEKTERVKARKGNASKDIKNLYKMQKSPAKMKTPMKKSKKKVEQDYARNAIADYKSGKKKEGNYEKKKALELAAGESGVMMKKSPANMDRKNVRKAKKIAKQVGKAAKAKSLLDSSDKLRDYSADTKGAKKLEKKSMKAHDKSQKLKREGYKSSAMMKTPMMKYDNSPALIKKAPTMMKTNQEGGGVAAKDAAAPAKQLKKLGSVISKHMKSN